MASKVTGSPQAFRQVQEQIYDPQYGDQIREVWAGPRNAILGLAQGFRSAGARIHVSHKGPLWNLVALLGTTNDGTTETPVDKWEIDTDFVQIPVWSNPKVYTAFGTSLAQVKKDVEDAIKDGKTEASSGFTGDKLSMFRLLSRGVEAHEIRRCALMRVRTVSVGYAQQVSLDAVEKVYTTASLKATFGIPAAVAARLPADPANPPSGTTWAWKVRRDTSEFVLAVNKVEEVKDWVFAAWETLLYDVV